MIMFYTALFFLTIHVCFIVYLYINFPCQIREFEDDNFREPVSIIIPFRNDSANLLSLLTDLEQEIKDMDEVFIVNDHSEDHWQLLESSLSQKENIKILHLQENEGKKAAIQLGVLNAKHENLITLDADVRLQKNWLGKIKATFCDKETGLILMPVIFLSPKNFIQRLGTIEFIALTGLTFSSAAKNHPMLANGANLAFRKSAYLEFQDLLHFSTASGDDIFLLNAIKNSGKWKVTYQNHPESAVYTEAPSTISELIQQRVRWIGKMRNFSKGGSSLLAISTFLTVELLAFSLIISIPQSTWFLFALLYLFKMLIDFIFLARVGKFFGQLKSLRYYSLVALIYPIYLLLILFALIRGNSVWKGRKIQI